MDSRYDKLGGVLIVISSILFGIFAVKHTIALRNILLWFGAFLSIGYLVHQWGDINFRKAVTLRKSLPLIILSGIFVWIIFHYLFLSRYPQEQFKELTSTWLRSALSLFLAVGTAVAIRKKLRYAILLWVGIFTSLLFLIVQYIFQAITSNNFFTIGYGGYIFHLKVNTVLVGSLMVSGLTGCLFINETHRSQFDQKFTKWFWLISMLVTQYIYVFALGARSGFALNVIVLGIAFIWTIVAANKEGSTNFIEKISKNDKVMVLVIFIFLAGFGGALENKAGVWHSFFDDVRVGLQVNKYDNWRDPETLGYPESSPGRGVIATTYERVAWPTAGLTIFAPQNPLGVGVMSRLFPRLLEEKYGKYINTIPATHSAWVDITLSYGVPGIILLLLPLFWVVWRSISMKDSMGGFIFILANSILLIYLVSEVGIQHGIEFLIYLIAFLSGLSMFSGLTRLKN
jgi:hypothetical protein